MNILYVNIQGVLGESGRALQRRGHSVVLRSRCDQALGTIRNFSFDAVLIEDDNNDPEILHFTVEAHQSHPALPIFVANTFGHGLLSAIEQFAHAGEDCADESVFSAMGQIDPICVQEFGRNS
jgi:hypothetical protein